MERATMIQFRRFTAYAAIATFAAGCSTTVGWDRNWFKKTDDDNDSDTPKVMSFQRPTFEEALAYAQTGLDQFESRINAEGRLIQIEGLSIIGLLGGTSAALTNGVSTTPLATATVAGNTLTAGLGFLSSRPRMFIYALGAKAITCSMRVALTGTPIPFEKDSKSAENKLVDLLQTQSAGRAKLNDAARRLNQDIAAINAETDEAARIGQSALMTLRVSGAALAASIDDIRAAVNGMLITTTPDAATLSNAIAGVQTAINQAKQMTATPVTDPPETKVDAATLRALPSSNLQELKDKLAATNAEIIARYQAIVDAPPANDQLKQCGVLDENILNPLETRPEAHAFEISGSGDALLRDVMVFGGSGNYAVEFRDRAANDDARKVIVEHEPRERSFRIVVGQNAPPGDYLVRVDDTDRANTDVTFASVSYTHLTLPPEGRGYNAVVRGALT